MSKKRIIFTATSDMSTDQRMHRICTAISEMNYDVIFAARGRINSDVAFSTKSIKCLFNSGLLFYMEFNIRSFLFLVATKSDAICSVDLDTMIAGRLATLFGSRKWIYDAHEYYTESPELDDRKVVKSIWEGIGKYTVPKVDLAYSVNHSIAEILTNKYAKEFEVIRNVPQKYIDQGNVEKESYILYQGVLNKGRGLESLIEAMQHFPNRQLYLAGEGDVKNKLEYLAKSKGLQNRIKFLGKILPKELIKITAKAWLGINILDPSNRNYKLSLANKFFDYMMVGTPSLSMDFPEYRLIYNEHQFAYLIPNIEVNTIVEAIRKLDSHGELYHKLQKNCVSAAQVYNWSNEKKQLQNLYSKLLPIP